MIGGDNFEKLRGKVRERERERERESKPNITSLFLSQDVLIVEVSSHSWMGVNS